MKTENVKLTQVSVNEANPRTIDKGSFEKLVKSILVLPKMLDIRPVVVDDTMVALGGNMRLRALTAISQMTEDDIRQELQTVSGYAQKTEGEQTALLEYWAKWLDSPRIPVVKADTLSDAEKREFIIKDNVGYGEWDMDALANEWDVEELEEWGVDVPQAKEEKTAEDDDFTGEDAEKAEAKCQLGDVWKLGNHRLMCGDSTKQEDVDKLMNDERADLLVTDPPYNVNYEGGTGLKIQNDNMEDTQFLNFLVDAFQCATNAMREGAGFYIWHADSEGFNFRTAAKMVGWEIRQCLIWAKSSLVLGRQDYQWRHKPCLYGWKDGAAHYFTSDRTKDTIFEDLADISKMTKEQLKETLESIMGQPSTILRYDKPMRNGDHPTMKPVELIGECVANSSQEEWLVLDLFGGSGTTLVACEQLGRRCNMMEFDPHYCDVIIARWEKLTGETAIKL